MHNSRKKVRYCSDSESSSQSNESESSDDQKTSKEHHRQRIESSIIEAYWQRKLISAETDNYKNHIREAMMACHAPETSPIVENAAIMQAIEEFGLVRRGNPFATANLETRPSRSTVSTQNNINIDEYAIAVAINSKGLSL